MANQKESKAKTKTSLIKKIKSLVPRKKATPGRAYKNALATKKSGRMPVAQSEDPAHSPGHRRMSFPKEHAGKKNRPQDADAMNRMAPDEHIAQKESNQRRIISGAALGKTGRQRA